MTDEEANPTFTLSVVSYATGLVYQRPILTSDPRKVHAFFKGRDGVKFSATSGATSEIVVVMEGCLSFEIPDVFP
jgi:hypothetical protein